MMSSNVFFWPQLKDIVLKITQTDKSIIKIVVD